MDEKEVLYLTDYLTGIIEGDYDLDQVRQERLKEKYEIVDDTNILMNDSLWS